MGDFLHGVETQEILAGPRPIREVKTAIIGIVGSAPIHHVAAAKRPTVNEGALVLSDLDVPNYGPDISGYSIPNALNALVEEECGVVVVINTFDPTVHKATVAPAVLAITSKKITLPDQDIISVDVTTNPGAVVCVEGTDFTVDYVNGVITTIDGGALDGATDANVGYDKADPSAVDSAAIIGTVDAGTGVRSGAQALLDIQSKFGFKPKILIAPRYSSDVAVATALKLLASELKLRAFALADAPAGTTFADALVARNTPGAVDLTLADERLGYCFPHTAVYDADDDTTSYEPLSQRAAGIMAKTDRTLGFWYSPSNKQIQGATGLEVQLTASLNDASCETNQLNAAGLITVFSGFGRGLRLWGNRSSAFPGSTVITTFIPVRRTVDQVDESVEYYTLVHLDGPVTQVLLDAVLEDVNAYIRKLIGRGALVPGSRLEAFAADNPPAELAAGHITFTKTYCPPPPAERITYKTVIDTNLLQLGS